jgi:hypothetical protein
MLQAIIEMVYGPSFDSLLWIFVTWITCGFIFTVEVLVTIWVIAELRTRLYKLKLRRKRLESGQFRQSPANRASSFNNSRNRIRFRRPDYEIDGWSE